MAMSIARIVISLLFLTITIPSIVLSFPTGAGTCDETQMSSQGHGSPQSTGTGGFSLSVSDGTTSGTYIITVNGQNPIEGLLLYTMGPNGDRSGDFTVPSNFQSKSCGGTGTNSLTHTSQSSKSMPQKFTWKPSSKGATTAKALVVLSFSNWYQLKDLSFDSSGPVGSGSNSSSSTPDSNTGSSNSDSSGGSSSGSGNSVFQQYLLFFVVIIITAVLYVIGGLVEAALRRQQVKARAFAKAVGGFDQ